MSDKNQTPVQQTEQQSGQPTGQTVIINQTVKKSNGLGTAGFVMAILGLIFCWVPVVDFILWILGLIFSFIGMFRSPRGLAIAGFIISIIGIIIGLAILGGIAAAIATV